MFQWPPERQHALRLAPLWHKTRSFWDIKNSLSRERGSERSERASERVSGASEQANKLVSSPVLTSLFLFVPDHSAMETHHLTALIIMPFWLLLLLMLVFSFCVPKPCLSRWMSQFQRPYPNSTQVNAPFCRIGLIDLEILINLEFLDPFTYPLPTATGCFTSFL